MLTQLNRIVSALLIAILASANLAQASLAAGFSKPALEETADTQNLGAAPTREGNLKPSRAAAEIPSLCPTGYWAEEYLLEDNLENGDGNWEFWAPEPPEAPVGYTSEWELGPGLGDTGNYALFGEALDKENLSYAELDQNIPLPDGVSTYLYFDHSFDLEDGYDGGQLQYSINYGTNWLDAETLFSAGQNYNATIPNDEGYQNPLKGERVFSGDSEGVVATRYDLTILAGESVRFRWRIGTDYNDLSSSVGWSVDNVKVYTCENYVSVYIGGDWKGSYDLLSHPSLVKSYPDLMAGPVQVKNPGGMPIFASQRAIVDGFSFDEYMGLPTNQLTTEYWFTWYDQRSPGLYTWVLVGNPSETEHAFVDIFIDGEKQGETHDIPPGGRITPTYPGTMGGPVRVKSDIPVFASERTIWAQNHNGKEIYSFNEVMGYPANQFTDEYWFTWYDQFSADTYAWVLVGNPSETEHAYVEIFIGGEKQGETHDIPPKGRITPTYPGTMAGPVRIKSDIPVFASERVIAGTSFNEVMGYPANKFDSEYWYPWYDNVTMYTWLLVGNPDPIKTAEVDVYIGGIQQESRYTIPPNGRITPMYTDVNNGPVRVVSVDGVDGVVDIFSSQRVVFVNGDKVGFNEMFGVPNKLLTNASEYWFTWYDNSSMNTSILVGKP